MAFGNLTRGSSALGRVGWTCVSYSTCDVLNIAVHPLIRSDVRTGPSRPLPLRHTTTHIKYTWARACEILHAGLRDMHMQAQHVLAEVAHVGILRG